MASFLRRRANTPPTTTTTKTMNATETAFECQALFIRTKGPGGDSWPDVLTVHGASTSANASGTLVLRRDKPGCYISTDVWSVDERTTLEVTDRGDVWLTCELTPTEKDGARSWKLLCRVPEESEAKETLPRWELNLEVSLVGKFKDCPCFLTQTARTTRRICSRGSSSSLHAIDEDAVALGEDKDGFAIIPGFSERFEETYRALGGTGSFSEGESGDLTWFNAGLRIGVGVGLGICLGAGLGAGILVRSYQMTKNSLKKSFSLL